MRRPVSFFVLAAVALVLLPAAAVRANLFTHILREAGEAGGEVAMRGASHLGAVGKAAAHLKALKGARPGALAAHATPEGHWQFVNREGQVFTAGTPDEMQRVMKTLAPDAAASADGKMTLFVSEDSVFQNRSALDLLPNDSELNVVSDGGAFRVLRQSGRLEAVLKPHVTMAISDQTLFREAVAYLKRPFNKSNVRSIGFEPGAKAFVPSAPRLDPVSKMALPDQVDPAQIDHAFGAMRGQTAVVAGKVEGGKLLVDPSTGPQIAQDLDALVAAARSSDVNLVVLHTDASRQPGALNWLWQRMEVGGLRDAGSAATNGDFLETLAARRGGFQLTASADGRGRVHFTLEPAETGGLADGATSYISDTFQHVTGEIVTKAADLYVRDKDAQSEIDARLIPGVPTYIQYPYLGSLIAGLFAWSTVRGWWFRLWPLPRPSTTTGRLVNGFRRFGRGAVYWLGFLPVAGFPAFVFQSVRQVWLTLTAPFRWVFRRFLRREV